MLKPKHHLGIAIVAFILLLLFGFVNKPEVKESIRWSSRSLIWDDFPILESIGGKYEAQVHSKVYYEGSLENRDLSIFASMNPNLSGRIAIDTITKDSDQLLIHEQYHFNVSEYCARLMRKEAVSMGKEKLTEAVLEKLLHKYTKKIFNLQDKYDTESNHNITQEKQRYWELKIDGLLRNTAYYADENLFNYQGFATENSKWFRSVEFTFKADLLTSIPESKAHSRFGDIYKVEKQNDSTIIQFYRNGKQATDSYFEVEKVIIITQDTQNKEVHLYTSDGTYNISKGYSIKKYKTFPNGNMELTYYDANGKKSKEDGISKITRTWNAEKQSFFSSYWDKAGNNTTKSDGPYYELRELDSLNRTKRISYFDFNKKPMLDEDFISVYEYKIDASHKITEVKLFDTNSEYAFHTDEYYTKYQYDKRGKLIYVENLDEKDEKRTNNTGVCIYEYAYDLYSNLTDTRKFNKDGIPVLGDTDYHQMVTTYDTLGRIQFEAEYYPGYVLKFSEDLWGASTYEYINDSIRNVRNTDAFKFNENNDKGIAVIKQYLNKKKQIIREDYLDANGSWAKTADLVNTYRYKYDEKGMQIESSSFDSLQQPKTHTEDVSIMRWEFDSSGNKIKTVYYNEKDELANPVTYATLTIFKYNNDNFLLESSSYDRDMKPLDVDGIFKIQNIPNKFGKDSVISNYYKNNKLIDGVCRTVYAYNKYGTLISEANYNKLGRPIKNLSGVHKIAYQYNKNQINIGFENYGIRGERVNNYSGIWKMKITLIPCGFTETVSYFNKNNDPVIGSEGYHKIENFWNEAQEVRRVATYGIDNELVNNSSGIADYIYQVDPSSISSRISFYDENRDLTEDSEGVAEYFYTPSMNGLYYLEKKLDKNGKKIEEAEVEESEELL